MKPKTPIRQGDTPETNQVSKIVLEWAEEFQRLMGRVKKHEATK